ncbi:MAG: arginase family protein [Deltaproteobacteria bacterium]|nr:arginase family protein [Deltaproteobacteria bacterium]
MHVGQFLAPEPAVDRERAWAVVLPAPFDRSAGGAPGARVAPAEIVAASTQVETYDLELGRDPTDRGLATLPPLELSYADEDEALEPLGRALEVEARAGRFPLVLGGESTVLAGTARGLARLGDVGVVRLEGTLGGDDVWHGLRAAPRTAVRRCAEHVPVRSSGWRLASATAREWATTRDTAGPAARRLAARPQVEPAPADELVRGLPEIVYLSLDLAVLDPAALPMPGNLEPGGLSYADLTRLLDELFRLRRVVGAELTGLTPHPGNVLPAFVAARLGLRVLALAHRQRFPTPSCWE